MSQISITTALFSTEKQGSLFDVGEPSTPEAPPVSLRRPVYLRSRLRVVYIQTGLEGVDEFAAEKRRLAEWGGPDGFCPRRDAGSNVCWWLSCRYHLRNDLGNAAENVMLLWRPAHRVETATAGWLEPGDVAMCFPKLKDGEVGIARIGWDKERARFTDPPNEFEKAGFYEGYETRFGGE